MAEQFVPPEISVFMRAPSDARLVRYLLKHNWRQPGRKILTACYVGCADCEDLISWLAVDVGANCDKLEWTTTDIGTRPLLLAREDLRGSCVKVIENDFRDGLPDVYDYVIANHVWVHDAIANASALDTLMIQQHGLIIARDHKISTTHAIAKAAHRGYKLYGHATPHDPTCSPGAPHIFAREGLIPEQIITGSLHVMLAELMTGAPLSATWSV